MTGIAANIGSLRTRLELTEVDDLVAAGYLPEPVAHYGLGLGTPLTKDD